MYKSFCVFGRSLPLDLHIKPSKIYKETFGCVAKLHCKCVYMLKIFWATVTFVYILYIPLISIKPFIFQFDPCLFSKVAPQWCGGCLPQYMFWNSHHSSIVECGLWWWGCVHMQNGAQQWHHSGTKSFTTTECRGYVYSFRYTMLSWKHWVVYWVSVWCHFIIFFFWIYFHMHTAILEDWIYGYSTSLY